MDATRRAALLVAMVSGLAYLVLAVLAFGQHFFDLDHTTLALIASARDPRLKSLMEALTGLGSGAALDRPETSSRVVKDTSMAPGREGGRRAAAST